MGTPASAARWGGGRVCELQEPIGQGGLPVVDVADDGEVADPGGIGHAVMVAMSLLESAAVANIKSQIKRNRQNEGRRLRNKAVRTRLKTEAKAVLETAAAGDTDAAAEQLRATSRMLDKAASKGA